MKKIVALILTVILMLSFVSCSLPESDPTSGVIFGSVDPFPYKDSEPKTHPDPAVEAFLNEKVTFLNKVYPDGNIPENEKELYYGVFVYVELNLPYSKYDPEEDGREYATRINEYTTAAVDHFRELGITVNINASAGRIRLEYESYPDFASTDLAKLAYDDSQVISLIEIASQYICETPEDYDRVKNNYHFRINHSFSVQIEQIKEWNDDKKTYIKNWIEGSGNEILTNSTKTALIPSVSVKVVKTSDAQTMIPELGVQGVCLDRYCTALTSGRALLVNEKDIYTEAEGDCAYLIYYGYPAGYTSDMLTVKGVSIENGKLKMLYGICANPHDASYGSPMFILKIDKSKLEAPLTELYGSYVEFLLYPPSGTPL